jgi:hypothetical protein
MTIQVDLSINDSGLAEQAPSQDECAWIRYIVAPFAFQASKKTPVALCAKGSVGRSAPTL